MLVPLSTTVLWSMGKDAFEDWGRHKSDDKENKLKVMVLGRDGLIAKNWDEIRVGEVVQVEGDS